ncbi:MAG: GC-type dockerin domain-anchored protein [Phycisphaerales bacterium]|jgi:hypothetical protein
MRTAASIAILAATSAAVAQGSPYFIEIRVDPPVIEPGETALVSMLGAFDPDAYYAIGTIRNTLLMSDGSEGMADFVGYGWRIACTQPYVAPSGVKGPCIGQYSSAGSGIYADPANPILYFTAEFTASAHMDPVVELTSATTHFSCIFERSSPSRESRLDDLIEGSATITIVACRADINEDGVLDIFDFLAFFNAFDAGEAIADFDFDGELTVFDFLAFQNRFDAGC